MDGKPYRNHEEEAEYWKKAYLDLIYKKGSYVNHLKELNETLRERQAFLQESVDILTNFIRRVDNTWTAYSAKRLHDLVPDTKPYINSEIKPSLRHSKWSLPPNE